MAKQAWETLKENYCQRVEKTVGLEAELVYAEGILCDEPPRILRHRCSEGENCNLEDKAACVWAGTNPVYDPFTEMSPVR